MAQSTSSKQDSAIPQALPIILERDEDGMYIVECPAIAGCYSQGKTQEEALQNIQEAIDLALEDEDVRESLRGYTPSEVSVHMVSIEI